MQRVKEEKLRRKVLTTDGKTPAAQERLARGDQLEDAMTIKGVADLVEVGLRLRNREGLPRRSRELQWEMIQRRPDTFHIEYDTAGADRRNQARSLKNRDLIVFD